MHLQRSITGLAAFLLLAVTACTAGQPPAGSVQFAASVHQALSAQDVTRVQVTVSAAGITPLVVELAPSNGTWGGLIGNIPAGANRSFLAEAFDASGTLRFRGQTSGVTLIADQTTAVAITLQEVSPLPPYGNAAPIIDSVVISTTSLQTGGSLSLTAAAHDPNVEDSLTFAWTASGGTFSAPHETSTSWTAPATPGVQTLTFTVTDSQGAAVSLALAINVISGLSTGDAAVNISFNLWPVVAKVSASRNRLDAGQSTTVSSLASDADGDSLSYQWTASCPGTWTDAASSTASFVPSSIPAGACNNCRLTVTVQDGRGGQNTGALDVCVTPSSTQSYPPVITQSYQSAVSAVPGQTVAFEVTAVDPQAAALAFTWTASAGALGTAAHDASKSRVTWTAPSCASGGTPPTLTATVTNAFNLTATRSFVVTGLPGCTLWTLANPMASPRSLHTATLLSNGTVLVLGGQNAQGPLATAELYAPALGTWSPAGALASPRSLHTATLLSNGTVLVLGGQNAQGYLATAELYAPALGTWSPAGSLASARADHAATLLPSGKVLVSGGFNAAGPSKAAELYEPASGTWSATGALVAPRSQHAAVLLPSGQVLILGGIGSRGASTEAEVYEPASGTWSAAAPMDSARYGHTATLLPDGKVLVAGGANTRGELAQAEVYEPASGTWSETGAMATPRAYHTATLLPNGKVLVSGGYGEGDYLAQAEVYDPASGTWSAAGTLGSPRYVHTATRLPSGQVLVVGGNNGSDLAKAEVYTP
jgi:hypothetical protein